MTGEREEALGLAEDLRIRVLNYEEQDKLARALLAEAARADALAEENERMRLALERIASDLWKEIPGDLSCGCYGTSGPYIVRCDQHHEIEVARSALSLAKPTEGESA